MLKRLAFVLSLLCASPVFAQQMKFIDTPQGQFKLVQYGNMLALYDPSNRLVQMEQTNTLQTQTPANRPQQAFAGSMDSFRRPNGF